MPHTVETISYITSYYIYIHSKALKKEKRRINFPTTNVLGKSIQMNKKVQMQACINLKKCKRKVGLHTKYYVVCGSSTILVEIHNYHVLTHGRILMLIHIESESHTSIWLLFSAVIFEIVQQASFLKFFFFWVILCKMLIENKRALGCQLQTGKYIAKLLCCHVWWRNTALSFKLYTWVRERGQYGLFIKGTFGTLNVDYNMNGNLYYQE